MTVLYPENYLKKAKNNQYLNYSLLSLLNIYVSSLHGFDGSTGSGNPEDHVDLSDLARVLWLDFSS